MRCRDGGIQVGRTEASSRLRLQLGQTVRGLDITSERGCHQSTYCVICCQLYSMDAWIRWSMNQIKQWPRRPDMPAANQKS